MFHTGIQDGCQNWRENIFCKKTTVHSADTLYVKMSSNHSVSLPFQDKQIFAFHAEIQDGRSKWRENNFCEKSQVDSTDTLRVKIFLLKLLYLASVSEIKCLFEVSALRKIVMFS